MAETLTSAFEKLDTELNKARQELQRLESAKQNAAGQVQDARTKAAQDLAKLKLETEQEMARITKDLPAIREQYQLMQESLVNAKRNLDLTKQETDLIVTTSQQVARKAEADAMHAVDEKAKKLAEISQRYTAFLKSLPPEF